MILPRQPSSGSIVGHRGSVQYSKRHMVTAAPPSYYSPPIEELLEPDTLTILAGNNTPIPYLGWVEVNFILAGQSETELRVPI